MSRLLKLASLVLLCATGTGCGYVAVSGAILTNTQTANGLVSIVQFDSMNGTSSFTVVTLVSADTANTFQFCGDQRTQFPVDTSVQAKFSPGANCDSLISVSWH
jgi:hypothetical protein